MILVGNKADLRDQNEGSVSTSRAVEYATRLTEWSGFSVRYLETSALTGLNIENVFSELVDEINIYISTQQNY